MLNRCVARSSHGGWIAQLSRTTDEAVWSHDMNGGCARQVNVGGPRLQAGSVNELPTHPPWMAIVSLCTFALRSADNLN
jgi:hypothetical protein